MNQLLQVQERILSLERGIMYLGGYHKRLETLLSETLVNSTSQSNQTDNGGHLQAHLNELCLSLKLEHKDRVEGIASTLDSICRLINIKVVKLARTVNEVIKTIQSNSQTQKYLKYQEKEKSYQSELNRMNAQISQLQSQLRKSNDKQYYLNTKISELQAKLEQVTLKRANTQPSTTNQSGSQSRQREDVWVELDNPAPVLVPLPNLLIDDSFCKPKQPQLQQHSFHASYSNRDFSAPLFRPSSLSLSAIGMNVQSEGHIHSLSSISAYQTSIGAEDWRKTLNTLERKGQKQDSYLEFKKAKAIQQQYQQWDANNSPKQNQHSFLLSRAPQSEQIVNEPQLELFKYEPQPSMMRPYATLPKNIPLTGSPSRKNIFPSPLSQLVESGSSAASIEVNRRPATNAVESNSHLSDSKRRMDFLMKKLRDNTQGCQLKAKWATE